MESTEMQVVQESSMSMKQVTDRVNTVHQILEKVMQGPSKENPNGVHYGVIPGCGKKMVLLKPGADLLAMTFRLVPKFDVERIELENGHREYNVTCTMCGPDGTMLGQGVGSASTMETKYRYRWEGGKWVDGKKVGAVRVENTDIADVYNTVLKIAKKRSHIDTTLTVTGAADLFTQDMIDEDAPKGQDREPIAPTQRKSEQAEPEGEPIISDAQRNRLWAIFKKSEMTEENLKAIVFSHSGVQSTKEVPKAKYEVICAEVEAYKA